MKNRLLKFALPSVLGIALCAITLYGLVGCEPVCADNQLAGDNGHCYSCDGSAHPSYTYSAGCSNAIAGVYCCPGGSTGCTPTGCPASHPWLCGATCYASPPSGNHACRKCP